jgi:hypothetical protein
MSAVEEGRAEVGKSSRGGRGGVRGHARAGGGVGGGGVGGGGVGGGGVGRGLGVNVLAIPVSHTHEGHLQSATHPPRGQNKRPRGLHPLSLSPQLSLSRYLSVSFSLSHTHSIEYRIVNRVKKGRDPKKR